MGENGVDVLIHTGHDMEALLGQAPGKVIRSDHCGWLGLSGEPDIADLNMAAIASGAAPTLIDDYVEDIRGRGLAAVILVDPEIDLGDAAARLGLTPAGTTPLMRRRVAPISPVPRSYHVRRATPDEVPTTNRLAAEAFSLDLSKVQHVCPPAYLSDALEVWVVEDAGELVGCGTFVRDGDTVGVYTMATPARQQRRGIGRAVLEHAMRHYQAQGVTAFTLAATAAGFHLYEQIGFRTLMEARVFVIGESTQFAAH
jgi:ribosomal protein S18 acetylase RimI-like enzyme